MYEINCDHFEASAAIIGRWDVLFKDAWTRPALEDEAKAEMGSMLAHTLSRKRSLQMLRTRSMVVNAASGFWQTRRV